MGIEFIYVCEIYLSFCMELANHVESCCVVDVSVLLSMCCIH
jgi:hypothetical protein